jgi:hypothetical protein
MNNKKYSTKLKTDYLCVLKQYELNPNKLKHCSFLVVAVIISACLQNASAHDRNHANKNLFPEFNSSRDVSLIRLRFSSVNGSSDECVLHFYEEATDSYDWMFDAIKMESLAPTAAECAFISADNYALSIDSRPLPESSQMVEIMTDLPIQSNYALTVIEATNLPQGFCFKIQDTMTGEEIPVQIGESFSLESNGPFSGNRFLLSMIKVVEHIVLQPLCNSDETGEIQYACSDSDVSVSLWQASTLLYNSSESIGSFAELAQGSYLVSFNMPEGNCSPVFFEATIVIPEPMYVDLLEYSPSACNSIADGFAIYAVNNSPEYNFSLTNSEGDIVLSGNTLNGNLIFDELSGDMYDLEIDGVCGVINTSIDLRDPNALQVDIEQENLGLAIAPQSGGVLLANVQSVESATYQWYLDNEWIGVGQEIEHAIMQQGNFSLRVEATNGICHASDSVEVHVELMTIAEGAQGQIPFSVLCTNRTLSFSIFESDSAPLQFVLLDMSGRQVWKSQVPQHAGTWVEASFGHLPVGQYVLRCAKSDEVMFSKKWVVH